MLRRRIDDLLSWSLAMLRLAALGLYSLLLLPVVIAVAVATPGTSQYWIPGRWWVWGVLAIFGVRLQVDGREKLAADKDYVLLANHRSLLDPPALAAAVFPRDTRFVSKKELRRVPLFGLGLQVTGQILIDRDDHAQSVAAIERRSGTRGISVAFFGEGRRARTRELLPFKRGAASFAIRAGMPIVPVAISGSENCAPAYSLKSRSGVIRVILGDPVDVEGLEWEDRGALTERLRGDIEAMLARADSGPHTPAAQVVENHG